MASEVASTKGAAAPGCLNIADLRLNETPPDDVVDLMADRTVWREATRHIRGPISEENEDILCECWNDLVHTKDPVQIMYYLIQDHILSAEQYEEVEKGPTKQKKMRAILNIVRTTEIGYYALVRAVSLCKRQSEKFPGTHQADHLPDSVGFPSKSTIKKVETPQPVHKDCQDQSMPSLDDHSMGDTDYSQDNQTKFSVKDMIDRLGLEKYFPWKITTNDITELSGNNVHCCGVYELSWLMLQTLFSSDYRGRDEIIKTHINKITEKYDSIVCHPLDIFVATYHCCDLILKQTLLQKMVSCQLAVPILLPTPQSDGYEMSLWALRTITIACADGNEDWFVTETSMVTHPVHRVACIRLGTPDISKSILLNSILNGDTHKTFFNEQSPCGDLDRYVAEGMIEGAWYVPVGRDAPFEDTLLFLNLRGDAAIHQRQLEILFTFCQHFIVLVDLDDLLKQSTRSIIDKLKQYQPTFVLTGKNKPQKKSAEDTIKRSSIESDSQVLCFSGRHKKNYSSVKDEVQTHLRTKLFECPSKKSYEECCKAVKSLGVVTDEENDCGRSGRKMAEHIWTNFIQGKHVKQVKEKYLSLQFTWQEWNKLLKQQTRQGSKCNDVTDQRKLDEEMHKHRVTQKKNYDENGDLMKLFISELEASVKENYSLFLHWLALFLDKKSRESLPKLQREYHELWVEMQEVKKEAKQDNKDSLQKFKDRVEEAEIKLAEASFGLEHFFREMGQIYEAFTGVGYANCENVERLPILMAHVMQLGFPLEIMDGDAAGVPRVWVRAVLKALQKALNNPRIVTMSVVGVQSSGKSTLLNTMFGIKFSVSAGRCTRGIYAQLVKVAEGSDQFPFDYILLLDTEGLRAPEMAQQKYQYDNELATLAIGIADISIINIKGENTSEVKDVLQIVVQALLRMRIAEKALNENRSCVFIHQNVSAADAEIKMLQGRKNLLQILDDMTVQGAEQMNIQDIRSFDQVINFDSRQHGVWCLPDLHSGKPPMCTINVSYVEHVLKIKKCLLENLSTKCKPLRIADFEILLDDMWEGILSENFVFFFRNTLETIAYDKMEERCAELTFQMEESVDSWLNNHARALLNKCTNVKDLQENEKELVSNLAQKILEYSLDSKKSSYCLAVFSFSLVTSEKEKTAKQYEDFFESNEYSKITCKWWSERKISLQSSADKVKNSKQNILMTIVYRRVSELRDEDSQKNFECVIVEKSKQVIQENRKKMKSQGDRDKYFDSVFCSWLRDTEKTRKSKDPKINVSSLVKEAMRESVPDKYSMFLGEEIPAVSKLTGCITLDDITDDHISVGKKVKEKFVKLFTWLGFIKQSRRRAFEKIELIFENIEKEVSEICRNNDDINQTHAKRVFAIFWESYHKKDVLDIQLNMRALQMMLTKVTGFIVGKFSTKHEEYISKYGPEARYADLRDIGKILFDAEYHKSTSEVIAADLLCCILKQHLLRLVRREMTEEIYKKILRDCFHTKKNLISRILIHLAQAENFHDYISYINDSFAFTLKCITNRANRFYFKVEHTETKNRYGTMAYAIVEGEIGKLKEVIEGSVKHTAV